MRKTLLMLSLASLTSSCSPRPAENAPWLVTQIKDERELHWSDQAGDPSPYDASEPDQVFTIQPSRWIGIEWIVPQSFKHPLPNLVFIRKQGGPHVTVYTESKSGNSAVPLPAKGSVHLNPSSEFAFAWLLQNRRKEFPGLQRGDRCRIVIGREDADRRGQMPNVYSIVELRVE